VLRLRSTPSGLLLERLLDERHDRAWQSEPVVIRPGLFDLIERRSGSVDHPDQQLLDL
jgi:hypothetical protein